MLRIAVIIGAVSWRMGGRERRGSSKDGQLGIKAVEAGQGSRTDAAQEGWRQVEETPVVTVLGGVTPGDDWWETVRHEVFTHEVASLAEEVSSTGGCSGIGS